MRAHLVQLDIAWEDREANHAAVERLIDTADVAEGDLIVLPELFDVGFSINIDTIADREGRTRAFIARLAEDLGVTVHGSRAVRDCHCALGDNCATVFGPDERGVSGPLCEYKKIHPFGYGRETEAFAGGDEVTTYTWRGPGDAAMVCAPAVCYDLRFPELFRAGVDRGAECFVLGANWPDARQTHWRTLLLARAIENQAFVLGVNRAGRDPYLGYAGGSMAVGPKGEVLGELGDQEGVLSVEVDPAAVVAWRGAFPALKDRRTFWDRAR